MSQIGSDIYANDKVFAENNSVMLTDVIADMEIIKNVYSALKA